MSQPVSTAPPRPSGEPPVVPTGPRNSVSVGAGASQGIDTAAFRGAFAVVILPTLNEEAGLERTLSELPFERFHESGRRVLPLIIDGGSTDGTLAVAQRWNVPVLRQTSRGKGGAMIEAVAWVHRLGIPYVIVLDADATYPPDRIVPALDLLRGGTDLVIGVRRPVWGPPRALKDLVHRVGNLVMSYSSSLLARRTILDLCSGFWGVSTERFMDLHLGDTSFAIESELVLKSIRRGYSMMQIPVEYRERLGVAKLEAVRDGGHILMSILQYARPSPLAISHPARPALWEREILSLGLTLGLRGAVVECEPAQEVEAGQLARYLRHTLPDTHVRVGAAPNGVPSALTTGPTTSPETPPSPSGSPAPLVVSLPSPASGAGEGRAVTISINSHRRQLTIQLPSHPELASSPVPPSPLWSRAGGWMGASVRRSRESFPSLLVVTSRLNFQPERQEQTFLSANGFRVLPALPGRTLEPAAPSLGLGSSPG